MRTGETVPTDGGDPGSASRDSLPASGGGTGGRERPAGRGSGRGTPRQKGFTLAALVVMMAVMAIFLTVAVETVTFQQRREKEEELIFRGNQVVEGVRLYRARFGRFPVKLEELAKANPRVLRKVWADPMTGKPDWLPVFLGEDGTNVVPSATPGATPVPTPMPTPRGTSGENARGPIIGVKSRVCQSSIKLYLGHTNYCDWKFFYDPSKLQLPAGSSAVPTPKP